MSKYFLRYFSCLILSSSGCVSKDGLSTGQSKQYSQIILLDLPSLHSAAHFPRAGDISYSFESTNKGNGTLAIKNLIIKVYDSHDDGKIFDPRFLTIIAFSNEHTEGLDITGFEVTTDDKTDAIVDRQKINVRFLYNPSKQVFELEGSDRGIVLQQ